MVSDSNLFPLFSILRWFIISVSATFAILLHLHIAPRRQCQAALG